MSNELLAKVAFAAMNGDGDESELLFNQYVEESVDLGAVAGEVDLSAIAKGCIAVLSGENRMGNLTEVAKEFGYKLYDTGQREESPNETETMEEEFQNLVPDSQG